jgi:hypothetical protein
MTIDINFVDASKLEIVKFDMLWIGRNVRWCNGSSLLVGATMPVPKRPCKQCCQLAVYTLLKSSFYKNPKSSDILYHL